MKTMRVEVAYALPAEQAIVSLEVADGATAEAALRQSGLLERFPGIDLEVNQVGVFGKLCGLSQVLRPGDRVEIYRPLIADPPQARRQRAARR